MYPDRLRDERGIALILTVLLALMVAGMAVGIILMMGNANLIAKFQANEAMMEMAADAGLEKGRDTLNGTPGIVPLGAGFVTLENNVQVRDANGAVIPGFTRSLYAGENGDTTGQFGNFASVISVIRNNRGAVVVRRVQLKQDPFSRFARFFNTWSCCAWGNTEVVNGPVHSNQGMALQSGSPGATFNGPVTTVSAITNQATGNWNAGVTTGVSAIPFPTTQTLNNLQTFAITGQTNIAGSAIVPDVDTRIEFVAVDLNGDGLLTGANEGFFRVFRAKTGGSASLQQDRRNYVTARQWASVGGVAGVTTTNDPGIASPNCGGQINRTGLGPAWFRADTLITIFGTGAAGRDSSRKALASAQRRCFLGGDRRLYFSNQFTTGDTYGDWSPWAGWAGAPYAPLVAALQAQGLASAANAPGVALTFWPLSRAINPNFKGVIYVTGGVGISGQLRGRVTVVATNDVMLADDITYVTPPGTTCADILGILTTNDAVIEDNNVNTPFNVNGNWTVAFDDSPNETFESFMLTLGNFQGESIGGDPGAVAPENCGGKSRGCKSIHGGTIQQGVSGTFTGNSGWAEQDTYDDCGVRSPPPYYPTTGRYSKNRYYEMDPVGFNVANWFAANQ
ncbi:MAG TPA: hypothetical protein VH438_08520 [Gemmatimonadales bacterium]|jgi:hypothetical protein